jgi:hypothetical protein
MTLVIAGYKYEKAFRRKEGRGDSSDSTIWNQAPTGIYFASDSAITDKGKTLLNGFRKIYPVRATVWEPYFVGEYFQGYLHEFHSVQVAVAFAGSTLSAQHYMNSITEHLGKLRITFIEAQGPIQYRICLHCEKNPFTGLGSWAFDETTFLKTDYVDLFTADVIAKAVLHSLQHALMSARKYKLDEVGFKSLFTEFALAVQCPRNRTYHLYHYPMTTALKDEVWQPRVELRAVPNEEVLVLGMPKEFSTTANTAQQAAMKAGDQPDRTMFDFLNSAIDQVKARGQSGIDYPSVMKVLKDGSLETTAQKKAPD